MTLLIAIQTKLAPPMRWTRFFVLYAKEKCGVSHSKVYFGSDDMSVDNNHHPQVIHSSLDILKGDYDVNTGVQEDSNNCGLWDLITMFGRARDLQDSVGKVTVEEL